LLEAVDHQDRQEEEAVKAETVNQLLLDRDSHLLNEAKRHKAPKLILESMAKFLSEDRAKRSSAIKTKRYLKLRLEARESLRNLSGFVIPETKQQVNQLIQKIDDLQTALADVDRRIAGIPSQEALADLLTQRQESQTAVNKVTERLIALDVELKKINRELEQRRKGLAAQLEKAVSVEFEHEDNSRVVFHSQRVRKTLEKFRSAMVERHVNRIAQLILDCFRQLLRKESLVSGLKIDRENFSLELYGADGKLLASDRLSAGERQLLAVSMLWGLARASGRPLPAVIDTPLGRLDASHRSKLVERYFPYASHQVLLLSTDKEIDEQYYERLKPYVGRTYHLEFDEALGSSQVKPGYFW
jgi:DNA sulfur modification protein DndD